MDNRDVPSTYTNLTEPEISNICNLGGNILTPVISAFSSNKVISHTDIKHHNKWAIRLNLRSSEPLITVFFQNKPIITLMDSGAEVSAMSSSLTNKLKQGTTIDKSNIQNCREPSGENLNALGTLITNFKIANQEYLEEFLVIDSLCSNLILSYAFMQRHGIILNCGNIITNCH